MSLKYNTLDVFTQTPFTGNQLGLVHVPASTTLSQSQKQQITKEFNYSETVFLHESSKPGEYRAQIFTPKSELPFAGHPTIGTAVWIFENLEKDRDEIVVELKAGFVRAGFDRETGVARALVPSDVRVHEKTVGWDRVGWSQDALKLERIAEKKGLFESARVPLVSPVKGITFALVDLSQAPELLERVVVTKDDIPEQAMLDQGWESTLIGNDVYVIDGESVDRNEKGQDVTTLKIRQRVMVIDLEDPATGAASIALAGYLSLLRGGKSAVYKFEITQGVEMGRESKIFLQVKLKEDGKTIDTVELSGQAVEIMNGTLRHSI